MKRLDLTGWAAIAEIVGTVAVVVSLLFVAHSVNRNTSIMQSVNDNFIYQLQDERVRDIVSDPELASIIVKFRHKEDISEVAHQNTSRMINRLVNRLNLTLDGEV